MKQILTRLALTRPVVWLVVSPVTLLIRLRPVPQRGESTVVEGRRPTVIEMEQRRIAKIPSNPKKRGSQKPLTDHSRKFAVDNREWVGVE